MAEARIHVQKTPQRTPLPQAIHIAIDIFPKSIPAGNLNYFKFRDNGGDGGNGCSLFIIFRFPTVWPVEKPTQKVKIARSKTSIMYPSGFTGEDRYSNIYIIQSIHVS